LRRYSACAGHPLRDGFSRRSNPSEIVTPDHSTVDSSMVTAPMAHPYRVILFDCVNTLYLPDASRSPKIEVDGATQISTAGLLLVRLAELAPALTAADVHRAQRAAWRWAEQQRGESQREIPAPLRVRHVLGLLGLPLDEALVDDLMRIHYRAVVGTFVLPPEHVALLRELGAHYRLALFSNFDHGPPLTQRLTADGLAALLDPAVVSADIGWRKPGAEAFRIALDRVGEAPERILFVGDSFGDDVMGARAAGVDCAWINPSGDPVPHGAPPAYTLRALTDLRALLLPAAGIAARDPREELRP
jgi:FMN phosphatase YigB (HAD superfamily)